MDLFVLGSTKTDKPESKKAKEEPPQKVEAAPEKEKQPSPIE